MLSHDEKLHKKHYKLLQINMTLFGIFSWRKHKILIGLTKSKGG